MNFDDRHAKHQRENHLSNQHAQWGFDNWVKNLRSLDQHSYSMWEIEVFLQEKNLKEKLAIEKTEATMQSLNATGPRYLRACEEKGKTTVEEAIRSMRQSVSEQEASRP